MKGHRRSHGTEYRYDDHLDRQVSETTAFETQIYGYDTVSNQTNYVDRNGRERSYDYDERDRLFYCLKRTRSAP